MEPRRLPYSAPRRQLAPGTLRTNHAAWSRSGMAQALGLKGALAHRSFCHLCVPQLFFGRQGHHGLPMAGRGHWLRPGLGRVWVSVTSSSSGAVMVSWLQAWYTVCVGALGTHGHTYVRPLPLSSIPNYREQLLVSHLVLVVPPGLLFLPEIEPPCWAPDASPAPEPGLCLSLGHLLGPYTSEDSVSLLLIGMMSTALQSSQKRR